MAHMNVIGMVSMRVTVEIFNGPIGRYALENFSLSSLSFNFSEKRDQSETILLSFDRSLFSRNKKASGNHQKHGLPDSNAPRCLLDGIQGCPSQPILSAFRQAPGGVNTAA
jgi:hypothetical protein